MIRFHLLGPIEVTRNGQQLAVGGSKIQTVLAILLLSRDRVVSDAAVSDLLWQHDLPSTSNAQIQTYVSRLRNQLGPQVELVRRRGGYLLHAPGAWVDVDEFENLAAAGQAAVADGRWSEAVAALRAAEGLWRGHALVGATEYLTEIEQPRLEELRLTVGEALMTAELALGNHHQVVSELTAMVSRHPLRENVRGLSMLALYRCGRQAEALATYDACRRHLAEELGIDPGDELKALRQAVLEQSPALATPAAADVPTELPPAVLDFVGRRRPLTRLTAVLRGAAATAAVVGLTGTGKTALALQAAHAVRDDYPDGQLYLNLAGSTDHPLEPAAALASLLRSLHVPDHEQPSDTAERASLFRRLASTRRMLVVLDDAVDEPQLRMLLPGGQAGVLITSQNRLLALEGALRIRLGGLSPAAARELLAVPGDPTRLLEATGRLPLALRVLGARLTAHPELPVSRVAARLAADPFGQLRIGDLDVEARIDAVYRRLPAHQQRALRLLSMGLNDPFSVWHAAVLLDAPLDATQDLLEELSQLHLAEPTGRGVGRLELHTIHPLVRAYALSRAFTQEAPQERSAALERIHRLWPSAA